MEDTSDVAWKTRGQLRKENHRFRILYPIILSFSIYLLSRFPFNSDIDPKMIVISLFLAQISPPGKKTNL